MIKFKKAPDFANSYGTEPRVRREWDYRVPPILRRFTRLAHLQFPWAAA